MVGSNRDKSHARHFFRTGTARICHHADLDSVIGKTQLTKCVMVLPPRFFVNPKSTPIKSSLKRSYFNAATKTVHRTIFMRTSKLSLLAQAGNSPLPLDVYRILSPPPISEHE